MKKDTEQDYQTRMMRVIKYIELNLESEINITELAKIAAFSEFHFHRVFTSFVGEPLKSFLRRLRLEKAAHYLIMTHDDIGEIGHAAGYQTHSAFGKAFKSSFGLSPNQFRKTGKVLRDAHPLVHEFTIDMEGEMIKSEIRTISDFEVYSVRKTGPYAKSAEIAWGELMEFIGKNNLFGEMKQSIGISYDNPDVTDADKLRLDACVEIGKDVPLSGNVIKQHIAGGKFAVFTHKGSYSKLIDTYREIYTKWAAESNEKFRECCGFEKYITCMPEVKEDDLITEVFIAIE